MEELFELWDLADNPMLLLAAGLLGGGGLVAFLLLGSYFASGDFSDLVWGLLLLVLGS